MTMYVSVKEAQAQLPELMRRARQGEEVLIEDEHRTSLRLVVDQSAKKSRVFGQHAGMGKVHDNFNDPLPESFWLGRDA